MISPDSTHKRVELVKKAVNSWINELVDLGGRNNLLYYRDLKQGTLALEPASTEIDTNLKSLLAGHKVLLSNLFDESSREAAARRVRNINAKAAENFQERGLQTLHIAWGIATWNTTSSEATPASPVLLRPINLKPKNSLGDDFEVELTEEWELNPSLLHMLKTEYRLDIDAVAPPNVADDENRSFDFNVLIEDLSKACVEIAGFNIKPRIIIGNFSYAKLPMVLDLEKSLDTMVESDLICSLAGDLTSLESLRNRHPEVNLSDPDRQPPQDEFLVLDADASQSYVINAVVGGADLVIDGPPGTGKSQTIANLIATLAARGKKILFVAEKRAAIDAVVDRLKSVGLEDLVLDLHDGAGSRRKLAENLAKSLASASSITRPDITAVHENLTQRKRTLIEVTDALHEIREPWSLSIYDAQSRVMAISDSASSTFRIRGEALQRMSNDKFRDAYVNLEKFIGLGGFTLASHDNPWGKAFTASTISTAESASQVLDVLTTLDTKTLTIGFDAFSQTVANYGLSAPNSIRAWGDALQTIRDTKTTLEIFKREIFELPLAELAHDLTLGESGGVGGWIAKKTNGAYRSAQKQASSLWIGSKPTPKELLAAVKKAQQVFEAWPQITKDNTVSEAAFGLLEDENSYQQIVKQLKDLASLTAHNDPLNLPFPKLCELIDSFAGDTTTLFKIPQLVQLNAELQKSSLGGLLADLRERKLDIDRALESLEYVWLMSIIEAVSLSNPLIGAFDGTAHSRTVTEFQRADKEHIKSASIRVRRAVSERITEVRDSFPRESEVIERQARLKRNHVPVRKLFEAAPNVLGALKPCCVMSPLVVSQLLPAQRLFDIVIFDEASQVSPADAIGALMRAEQAVVAGDPRQLPPTSFFASSSGGAEDEEGTEGELIESDATKDMESILDAMSSILPPPIGTRTLGWHYRSKDERLIAFSNAQSDLYNFSMTTFPGVSSQSCINHVLVPFHPNKLDPLESGADEVRKVVELVVEHAAKHPSESLGVITMGIKHANRIEESLRHAIKENPTLEAFISGSASTKARNEMFFVKNLERVQGDERDSIILTIGYGKTADGRMQYRFGPINMQGGHRRLNVAITRARKKITLVSSFSSADMDPTRLNSVGAKMLGQYLAYAESGGIDLGNSAKEKPEMNPFERDVLDELTKSGIPLIAQYGSSGYWIDFAAQHPKHPGQMVLAIECDGATYHSSHTARNRDRLRQEHLERLGWRFHRIWSQDWFRNHENEIERAIAAYRTAVESFDAGLDAPGKTQNSTPAYESSPEESDSSDSFQSSTPTVARNGNCPVSLGRPNIDAYSHGELVSIVRWIESDTLLRTESELLSEAVRLLGFARKGTKITSAINAAISTSRRRSEKHT